MYTAENIDLSIGTKKILEGASASITPGEITVIIGPNGAGKSTLLKAMAGELPFSRGEVRVNGTGFRNLKDYELALIRAVLPQSSALSFPFTVYEVVRLGMLAGCPGIDRETVDNLPQQALQRVGMEDYSGRYFQELSGGEQQRVHLARVLCQVWLPVLDGQPRYLFLDEPTSSLDMRHQLMILQLTRNFVKQGGGALAVLHDLNIAVMFADNIIAMKDGHIVAAGPPQTVVNNEFMREVFSLPVNVSREPTVSMPYLLPQTVNLADITREA